MTTFLSPSATFRTLIYAIKSAVRRKLENIWIQIQIWQGSYHFSNGKTNLCQRVNGHETYSNVLLFRSLLGLHGVHRCVDLVVVGVLNAADRNTVVDTSRINRGRQRILRKLELCNLDQNSCIVLFSLTGVLKQHPDLFRATRSRF